MDAQKFEGGREGPETERIEMSAQQQQGEIVKPKSAVATFRDLLEQMKPQMLKALPKHLDIDRMLRIAMTSVQKVPKLLECSPQSLLAAVIQCAQLGLEPDGVLGEAYLIPYGKICTLIPGYRGLLKLARQSGEVLMIEARVVHAHDVFTYEYGLDLECRHVPSLDDDPGLLTHVYAVARMKNGEATFEVMTKKQVDLVRQRSMASGSGPWVTDYEEMAKKTVLRRLCKMLPLSVEKERQALQRAVTLDEREAAGMAQDFDIVLPALEPASEPKSKLAAVAERRTLGAPAPSVLDIDDAMGPLPDAPPVEEKPKAAPKKKGGVVGEDIEPPISPDREPGSDD